jgi:putative transcriptional regulator
MNQTKNKPVDAKPRSPLLAAAHETAQSLLKAGIIGKATMAEFDAACLQPVRPLSSRQIKKLREKLDLSQPVFAACLNVSPATVKAWEQGAKKPNGASLRLLQIVERRGLEVMLAG